MGSSRSIELILYTMVNTLYVEPIEKACTIIAPWGDSNPIQSTEREKWAPLPLSRDTLVMDHFHFIVLTIPLFLSPHHTIKPLYLKLNNNHIWSFAFVSYTSIVKRGISFCGVFGPSRNYILDIDAVSFGSIENYLQHNTIMREKKKWKICLNWDQLHASKVIPHTYPFVFCLRSFKRGRINIWNSHNYCPLKAITVRTWLKEEWRLIWKARTALAEMEISIYIVVCIHILVIFLQCIQSCKKK